MHLRVACAGGPSRSSRCLVHPRELHLLFRDLPIPIARVRAGLATSPPRLPPPLRVSAWPPLMGFRFCRPLHQRVSSTPSAAAEAARDPATGPASTRLRSLTGLTSSLLPRVACWPAGLLHPAAGHGVRRLSSLHPPSASAASRLLLPPGLRSPSRATLCTLRSIPLIRSRHDVTASSEDSAFTAVAVPSCRYRSLLLSALRLCRCRRPRSASRSLRADPSGAPRRLPGLSTGSTCASLAAISCG